MRLRTSLAFLALLLGGCAHRVVRGNPLTLPTLEKGKGAITHLDDEREAQDFGDVTISQKSWVLHVFESPFAVPAKCNWRDLTSKKGKLKLKLNEPDGWSLEAEPGHRIHFACQGVRP